MKKILIIGQKPDPHIDKVIEYLNKFDVLIKFIDFNDLTKTKITLNYNNPIFEGYVDDNDFRLVDVNLAWYRLKPSLTNPLNSREEILWSEFVSREWKSLINGLFYLIPSSRWINSPLSFNYREKPVQLFIAKEIGFNIPSTIISNDSSSILRFLNDEYKFIYKILTWYFDYPNKGIFTNRVNKEMVKQKIRSVKVNPGIFQREIQKAFELRITTVGNKIFSAKIHSQAMDSTQLDWRRNQLRVKYTKYDLPTKIEKMIFEMNSRMELNLAAYDFIVTPEDEFYFLEVNPGGQWLWIEEILDLPISKTVAEYMVSV